MDKRIADVFAKSFNKFKYYLRGVFSELSEYDAEDIISQTALSMLDKDDDHIDSVSAYVYTALRNTARNHFRKRQKEVVSDVIDQGHSETVEDVLIRTELNQQIVDALMMLDEKSRFVFVETELGGKSYKELSEQTGEPIGTLLSRKSRAAKKLSVLLDDYYD